MTRGSRWTLVSALTAAAVAVTASVVYAASAGQDGRAPLVAAEDVQPAVTGDNCKLARTDFTTAHLSTTTASTAFVDMAEMQDTFSQGGRAASCVVVNFTAQVFAPVDALFIRAVLDGAVVGSPLSVRFSGDDDEDGDNRNARSHAMNFVFPGVAPGTHTVSIQWAAASGTVQAVNRTLLVHHR
jgi:hypothetical protein